MVGEGDFARAGNRAAADQPDIGDCMMWAAEWPRASRQFTMEAAPGRRMNAEDLEVFLGGGRGMIVGMRFAIIDLPAPGGPMSNKIGRAHV